LNETRLNLGLAKSKLENEEGLNYLRIAWNSFGPAGKAFLRIELPSGVKRKPNLSGFEEDADGRIFIHEPDAADELLIEIYTDEAVPAGRTTIVVELAYADAPTAFRFVKREIDLEIAAAEEALDGLIIDEEVVNKMSELGSPADDRNLRVDAFYDPIRKRRLPLRSENPGSTRNVLIEA